MHTLPKKKSGCEPTRQCCVAVVCELPQSKAQMMRCRIGRTVFELNAQMVVVPETIVPFVRGYSMSKSFEDGRVGKGNDLYEQIV